MKWLIETEVFNNDTRLPEALTRLGVEFEQVKFGKPYNDYLQIGDDVVVHGGSQLVSWAAKNTRWRVYGNSRKYNCTFYYPKFREHLLNSQYRLIPIGDAERFLKQIFINSTRQVFVKSNDFKYLKGQMVSQDEFLAELKLLRLRVDHDELLLFSPVNLDIKAEWRLVINGTEVVAGCQYKPEREEGIPTEVEVYAKNVLKDVNYNPDKVWIMDICKTHVLNVLEVGPFSCCGLYDCNLDDVVKFVNRQH